MKQRVSVVMRSPQRRSDSTRTRLAKVALFAVGVHMGEIDGVAGRPAVADLNLQSGRDPSRPCLHSRGDSWRSPRTPVQAVVEAFVVGPDAHVVGLLLPDLVMAFSAHGVECDNAAFQAQHAQ